LVNAEDDVLLVSRKGQAIRFRADDSQLRPMGRATSGVMGMKFRNGDQLLSMSVIRADQVAAEEAAEQAGVSAEQSPEVAEQYVFTITEGGFAKRSRISQYRLQSRGGLGIKAMKQDDERGNLVGAFIVVEGDEVLAIKQSGQVTRSAIDENLRPTGRDTKGVKFVGVSERDGVAVVARSVERAAEIDEAVERAEVPSDTEAPEGEATPGVTIEDDGEQTVANPAADETDVDSETEES
jgi:DNA gyrase subunit A